MWPWRMSPDIVPSGVVLESLREEFGEIVIPIYKFRRLFSRPHKVFFDCEGEEGKNVSLGLSTGGTTPSSRSSSS